MKSFKHAVSVILIFAMIICMATVALAAESTGSITVSNPIEGEIYTAYKIFDVKYNDTKDAYAYTIEASSEWFLVVKDYPGLTLTAELGDTGAYFVTETADFSAAAFAAYLKENKSGKTGIALSGTDTVSASNLPLGYYFVTSTNGALCNLTTTNPDVTIRDKNDIPFEKEDDASTVEVGQIVKYVITAKVPDTTGFETYTYKITDTMSAGLTFNKDVQVTGLLANTYELSQNDTGFTLNINAMQNTAGTEITVVYSAIVNENAVSVISKNNATLTYSNNPTDGTSVSTITVEETVYSAKIVIDKYKAGDKDTKLAGAKFVLKNSVGKYYKWTPAAGNAPAAVTWVDAIEDATEVTTDENGAARFEGLKDGTYKLLETEAPQGYNMLTEEKTIVIDGKDATENDTSLLTATENVENNTGTTLPETGGIGTTLFYVLGSLLAVGAVVLLVVKKRMNNAE